MISRRQISASQSECLSFDPLSKHLNPNPASFRVSSCYTNATVTLVYHEFLNDVRKLRSELEAAC